MPLFSFAFFLVAALFTVALTPLSIRLAYPLGAIDLPDGFRKRHSGAIPRLCGLAIYFAVFFVFIFFFLPEKQWAALLSGGAIIAALGISDDIFSLSPWPKLLAEGAAASLPFFLGLAPTRFTLGEYAFSLPPTLSLLFTVFWVMTLTNAFNMIDGLNGLAATQTLLSALSLGLFASSIPAFAIAGAAFGFLPYNQKKPKAFLGDGGALFFGYALGVLSLGTEGTFSLFIPFLFLVPLWDVASVVVLRLWQKRNPFLADSSHLHHRLCQKGFDAWLVVCLLALLSLGGVAGYLLLSYTPLPPFATILFLILWFFCLLFI
ncbi:MAG: undecaprenyl/decaprenyl-phosphate alpha-N-acetylglucosaminyl 1-phosphate transferase [Clostridia bacterium]|nr:undecaprenyl/decaprenyl-phosphate alpha-N-acetylglucosaminyl 1-phosphate transferase [Clostridia bacterium]